MDDSVDTLTLTRRLIACRSITPDDGGGLALIADRLAARGFACERLDRNGVGNLWAVHGMGDPVLCLAGHIDVVPPGALDRWQSDPFEPSERGGFLYGRGAVDMKTSVAAMVTAAERVVATRPDHAGTIAILLTSDEEGEALDGTVAVVDTLTRRGTSIAACIVGEPTSSERLGDTIKNGRRGSLNGSLRVHGVQCHIAYPERGLNPVAVGIPALAELMATEWDRGNAYFPPTSFQISNIQAGTGASNVIPGSMEVQFNFRYSPECTREDLEAHVRAILDRHGVRYDVSWVPSGEPFMTARGHLVDALSRAIHAETGVSPVLSTSGGTSDGRFIARIANEVVEFGPVNETVHKIDECVRLADIDPLSRIYENTLLALLTSAVTR
ncbi:MAG: succinyl-diaminopimelate desuccinylase [Vicinamibacterales bacterium]